MIFVPDSCAILKSTVANCDAVFIVDAEFGLPFYTPRKYEFTTSHWSAGTDKAVE